MGLVVIPAIDLLGGRCVRLTQGDYGQSKVYSTDPREMVRRFAGAGARRIHVVDLDAARGRGDNSAVIVDLLGEPGLELQVAGGVRTEAAVDSMLERGAHRVVMGTAAVTDPALLAHCAERHPSRVLAALDVRAGLPAVSGWTETVPVTIEALISRWEALDLAGIIVTSIERDGMMAGPDLETVARVRKLTHLDLVYSGGVTSVEQLTQLAAAGAQAVIVGKAIYEGRITLEEAFAI